MELLLLIMVGTSIWKIIKTYKKNTKKVENLKMPKKLQENDRNTTKKITKSVKVTKKLQENLQNLIKESTKYKKIIREFKNYKKITKPKKNPK